MPQIIAVAHLLIYHVRGYVVPTIVRTTIVKNEFTSSMGMMDVVNIKMETLLEKHITLVIVVKTNCLKIIK